jgi:1,4-alpha-glucan branching enzyme
MGEEWGCRQPFVFFCDFPGELGEAVRTGRRREFPHIQDMPDPLAEDTFRQCVLAWQDAANADGKAWLGLYRELLQVRREKIVPLQAKNGTYRMLGRRAFEVRWDKLVLIANCGDEPVSVEEPESKRVWSSGQAGAPWSVGYWLA